MPIHRLNEEPSGGDPAGHHLRPDGKIDRFVGGQRTKRSLDLHPLRKGALHPGVLLTGPTRILGDLHNLFGDTHAVHIRMRNGGYEVSDLVRGDTVTDVLAYVEFMPGIWSPPSAARWRDARTSPGGGQHVHRRLQEGLTDTRTSSRP